MAAACWRHHLHVPAGGDGHTTGWVRFSGTSVRFRPVDTSGSADVDLTSATLTGMHKFGRVGQRRYGWHTLFLRLHDQGDESDEIELEVQTRIVPTLYAAARRASE